jgi:hypothetical protein
MRMRRGTLGWSRCARGARPARGLAVRRMRALPGTALASCLASSTPASTLAAASARIPVTSVQALKAMSGGRSVAQQRNDRALSRQRQPHLILDPRGGTRLRTADKHTHVTRVKPLLDSGDPVQTTT